MGWEKSQQMFRENPFFSQLRLWKIKKWNLKSLKQGSKSLTFCVLSLKEERLDCLAGQEWGRPCYYKSLSITLQSSTEDILYLQGLERELAKGMTCIER